MRDISVLLIEDNGDDEWLALWALKKIGITRVRVARDGCEALSMLHGSEGEIMHPDLILLDLRLPKVDGLEVLQRIRDDERTREIAVLVLTSSEDPHDKETCAKLGVTAILSKPLQEQRILQLGLFPE
jgi:CheY-like chemotaxis protein